MKNMLLALLLSTSAQVYCVTDSIPSIDSTAIIEINDINKRIDSYLNTNTIGLVTGAVGSVMAAVGVITEEPMIAAFGAVLGGVGTLVSVFSPYSLRRKRDKKRRNDK